MLCSMYYFYRRGANNSWPRKANTWPEITMRVRAGIHQQAAQPPSGSTLLTSGPVCRWPQSWLSSLGAAFPTPGAGDGVILPLHPLLSQEHPGMFNAIHGDPWSCLLLRKPVTDPLTLPCLLKSSCGPLCFLKPSTGPPSVTCTNVTG